MAETASRKPVRKPSRPRKTTLPEKSSTPPVDEASPSTQGTSLGATPKKWAAQIQSVADQVLNWAGTAAEMAVGVARPLLTDPSSRRAVEAAGSFLRDARQTAGFTTVELAEAVKLEDTKVLELAESGKIGLSFEIILRIASLLSRNDPIPFALQLTRGFAPSLWATFEQIGIARLVVHAGREHEFINIYRSRDAVRKLSDAEFAKLLKFVSASVDMTVGLVEEIKGHTPGE